MAKPVANTPVLHGEDAKALLKEFDEVNAGMHRVGYITFKPIDENTRLMLKAFSKRSSLLYPERVIP